MAKSSENASTSEPKKSDEYEISMNLGLMLNNEELGLLIDTLQKEYDERIAKEEIAARNRRLREEIEARNRHARIELENKMMVHASEFEDWSRRRQAYISRLRGEQRVVSDDEEEHGTEGRCRGSETESGSDEENQSQNHHEAMAIESDNEEVQERRKQRRKEALFHLYWKEKTEKQRKFSRTMKERLPGEGRSKGFEDESADSDKDTEDENEEEEEGGEEDEEMKDYGPASSDSDGGDPDDGGYPDEMDEYEDDSDEGEY